MLRDKSSFRCLTNISGRWHCVVRIAALSHSRADLQAWQLRSCFHFEQEIRIHFAAEESVIFPAARQFAELVPLVEELIASMRRCVKFLPWLRRASSPQKFGWLRATALGPHP